MKKIKIVFLHFIIKFVEFELKILSKKTLVLVEKSHSLMALYSCGDMLRDEYRTEQFALVNRLNIYADDGKNLKDLRDCCLKFIDLLGKSGKGDL